LCAIGVVWIERLAALELENSRLQILELLVVVALGRRDRGVSEQVADLRERDAAFDQA